MSRIQLVRRYLFGFGSGVPLERDGALLAQTSGSALEPIGTVDEQGIHELLWWQEQLHIAGTDPCCGDTWEAGNSYVYNPISKQLNKYRDDENGLPNVIHTWSYRIIDNRLMAATSGHAGDFETRTSQIFASDDGIQWENVSQVGQHRTFDLAQLDGGGTQYYALYNDKRFDPVSLAVSDDLITWTTPISGVLDVGGFTLFNGELLSLSYERTELYAIGESIRRYVLPFKMGASVGGFRATYNSFVVVDDVLYGLAQLSDGRSAIVRSADLRKWQTIVKSSDTLASLTYWPAKGWLVVGSAGRNAKLSYIDLPPIRHEQFLPVIGR